MKLIASILLVLLIPQSHLLYAEDKDNLVKNSDFAKRLQYWELVNQSSKYFIIEDSGPEGRSLCCLPSQANAEGFRTLRQHHLTLTSGAKYTLSVVVKSEGASFDQQGGIAVINNGWKWGTGRLKPTDGSGDWRKYVVSFVAPQSSDSEYQVVIWNNAEKETFWVANIQLVEE